MIQLSYSGMRRAAADGLVGIGRASLPALVQLHRHALSKGDSQLRAYTSGAINRIDPKIAAQEGIR